MKYTYNNTLSSKYYLYNSTISQNLKVVILMGFLLSALKQLKELYGVYMTLLVIAIGLFTFFVDLKKIENKNLKKDYKIARTIGFIYLIGGPLVYIVLRFLKF